MKTKGDVIMVGNESTTVVKFLGSATHADRYLVQHAHGGYSTVDKEGNILNDKSPPVLAYPKRRSLRK